MDFLFGAAYYDEYMPYERVDEDFRLMREAGMNTIRIGESTWATYEPLEGQFDFSHLIHVLDKAQAQGMQVIVGTPTYAVPVWLVEKDPTVMVDSHHGRARYGARQLMDITNKTYLYYGERIIRKQLEIASCYSCVIGYQLDNETKHFDTCSPEVQRRFREMLRSKYGTVEKLNQAFNFHYWSNAVGRWDDLPDVRGTINGSYRAEFERFQRSLVTEFLLWQEKIVREYLHEGQFLTHNFDFGWQGHSYGVQPDVPHDTASTALTLAGCDIYHPMQKKLTGVEAAFCGSLTRCLKDARYLVCETEAQGFPEWTPYPGQLYQMGMMHAANGACGVMYWHWASLHNACETYWKGVLSHDLQPNAVYREAMRLGADLKKLSPMLENAVPTSRIALLVSNEALTGLKLFPLPGGYTYNDVVRWMFDACYHLNLPVDVVFSAHALDAYDLLLVPAMYAASDEQVEAIHHFAERGGHVIASFKTAFADDTLTVRHEAQPYGLTDVLGIQYQEFSAVDGETLEDGSPIHCFLELVQAQGAQVLHTCANSGWEGTPLVTRNAFQKGQGTYFATMTEEYVLQDVLREEAESLGMPLPAVQFPLVQRDTKTTQGTLRFLFNFSMQEKSVCWTDKDAQNVLTGETVAEGTTLHLPKWGVLVLRMQA